MYTLNHIHLKAPDPMKTAQWYVDTFSAEITGQAEGMGGAKTVRIALGETIQLMERVLSRGKILGA